MARGRPARRGAEPMRDLPHQSTSGFLVCAYLAALTGLLLLVLAVYFGLVPALYWAQ